MKIAQQKSYLNYKKNYPFTLLVSKGMGQADTLAARCCVKG
jgi:hypothetical protein